MNEDYEIEEDGSNEEFEIEQVLRPKLFVDFEGQDKIVDNLKVFIEIGTFPLTSHSHAAATEPIKEAKNNDLVLK